MLFMTRYDVSVSLIYILKEILFEYQSECSGKSRLFKFLLAVSGPLNPQPTSSSKYYCRLIDCSFTSSITYHNDSIDEINLSLLHRENVSDTDAPDPPIF